MLLKPKEGILAVTVFWKFCGVGSPVLGNNIRCRVMHHPLRIDCFFMPLQVCNGRSFFFTVESVHFEKLMCYLCGSVYYINVPTWTVSTSIGKQCKPLHHECLGHTLKNAPSRIIHWYPLLLPRSWPILTPMQSASSNLIQKTKNRKTNVLDECVTMV